MKRKTKKWLALVCSVCAVTCIAAAGIRTDAEKPYTADAATAESITLSQELETAYVAGDILQIPSATIVYGGNTYVANENVIVYRPDGSVLSGTRFTLDQTGNYTIVYETDVSGVRVTAEKAFSVVESAYLLPSSCTYAYSETVKTQNPAQFSGGLNVDLAMGAEFVYNKAIDISASSLDTPVVTFAPYQYSNYMLNADGRPVAQAKEFYVRLTDAYDKDNYIELLLLDRNATLTTHESGKRRHPYPSAGAAGQEKYGLDTTDRYNPTYNNGKLVNVDGSDYCAVYENFGVDDLGLIPCGQAVDNSGVGGDGQGGYYSVYYDSATARIYLETLERNADSPAVKKRLLVNDLDNTNLYPTNAFKGFTTGEVYLSIRADEYLTDKMQFELLEVYGETGAALAETTVKDTRAPLLLFDKVAEGQNFLVQKNSVVKLPTATAYDVYLQGAVETRVYYAYGTDKQVLLNSDNGEFTPTKTGAYTVEYVAKDTYGNLTKKLLLFSCIDGEVLSFGVEKLENGLEAGTTVTLPAYEIESFNGQAYVDVYATYAGEKIEIDETEQDLFVDYAGEYTITYEYGDILTKKTYSYQVTSVVSDNIVFGAFNLPKYFIKDANYTLDTVYAYTYEKAEPTAVEAEVWVKEDGAASFKKIDFDGYKVKATETVQFQYTYEDVKAVSEVLPVVDVGFNGKLDMTKYFVGDITATAEKKYVEVMSNATTGDTTVKFINPIAFSLFYFEFSVPETAAAYDGLEIKLTDYYDESVSTVIAFYRNGNLTQWRIGDFVTDLTYTFEKTEFAVWYESTVGKMMEGFGGSCNFVAPFQSDRVFLEFTLKNARGANAVQVSKICNQDINNAKRDRFSAAFSYKNLFGGLNEINKTVTVYAGEATDVLSPYYADNLRVSVTTPQGAYVTAKDGTVLESVLATRDYQFTTQEYGLYLVSYSYLDQSMNEVTGMYYMSVVDMQSPTIELAGGYGEKTRVLVDVGDDVEIADHTVSDNLTPSEQLIVKIFVLRADGEMLEVTDGTFNAKHKGDYVVYYYCYDTDDNYAIAKYYVRAE